MAVAVEFPTLEVRTPIGTRSIRLSAPVYRLGRHPDNDIVVDLPTVSRFHLALERLGTDYVLRDTSTNGTFQGGTRVSEVRLVKAMDFEIGTRAEDKVWLAFRPVSSRRDGAADQGRNVTSLHARSSLSIGRDPDSDLTIEDPLCSRHHARLERRPNGLWIVQDLGSSNGTFVNSRRIDHATLERGAVLQIGNTRLIFDGNQLHPEPGRGAGGTRVDARDLTKVDDQGRVLVDRVCFSIAPGEFVAVLGVSGAGKTTLLGAINGLRPATRGDLWLDGISFYAHRDAFRHTTGYVPQEDIIHRELTVERALWYSGRLRMPSDTSSSELARRVTTVLDEVGLSARRTAPIARLSGGQRKRVSIAVEIMTRPPLLLLDEPTSGLDPGLDKQLMTLLHGFSDSGQTVAVVTHAVANINLCDHVLFLAGGGRLAFFGGPAEARVYFNTDDFAEIYRKVETEKDPSTWRDDFEHSTYFYKNVVSRLPAAVSVEPMNGLAARSSATVTRPPRRPVLRQFAVLTQRYFEIVARDRGNLVFLLGQAPIVAGMLWVVAGRQDLVDAADPIKAHKLLFLMACAAAWFGIINSVRELVKEAAIYQRERNIGVSIGAYIASKMAVLTLVAIVQTALLVSVVALRFEMPGASIVLPATGEMYVTLLLTSVAGCAFGLALSSMTVSSDRAMSLTPLLLIPQIVFAGMVFKLDGAAEGLAWLTATHASLQGLSASARLGVDPHGQILGDATRTPEYVLTRWGTLLGLIAVGLLVTALSLRVRDREGPLLVRLAHALVPGLS